uniref:uncharacterized protein LOC120330634 n=1 Tax=Styela clava TaxID=7725 RepID=UPI00193ABFF9|nr:uncharacterized protein LOC120330634 [Styela clava]
MDQNNARTAVVLFTVLINVKECQALGECGCAATIVLGILLTIVSTVLAMVLCRIYGRNFNIFGTCCKEPESRQEVSREEGSPYFTTRGMNRGPESNEHRRQEAPRGTQQGPRGGNVNVCLDVQGDLASRSESNFLREAVYGNEEFARRNMSGSKSLSSDFSQAYAYPHQQSGPELRPPNPISNSRNRHHGEKFTQPSTSGIPRKPPRQRSDISPKYTDIKENASSHGENSRNYQADYVSPVEVTQELPPRDPHYVEQEQQNESEDVYTMAGEYPGGLSSIYSQVQRK